MGIFNVFGKVIDKTWKTIEVFDKATFAKQEFQKAEFLAQTKHLREAAKIGEEILTCWSGDVSFTKHLVQHVTLRDFLEQVRVKLGEWSQIITEADNLANRAKSLLATDTANPLDIQALSAALTLFKKSNKLIYDEAFIESVSKCEQEILKRQKFQTLVAIAEEQVKKFLFKQAVKSYLEAKQLYQTNTIQTALKFCSSKVEQELAYETALQQTQQAAQEGKLRGAIARLESALTKFPRQDGIELLEKLQRTVKGKEKFRQGLNAEKMGALKGAASMYEEAKTLLSDPTQCHIRLGLVAIKIEDWAKALSHLKDVPGEQAAYLRGFANAKLGNLQQAHRDWQPLTQATVAYQRSALKNLAQSQRLLSIQNIEQLVKVEKLEEAKVASDTFIEKFGADSLIQANLDEHIQPRIETAVWKNSDWGTITDTVEQAWISQPNLTSLHNWVVANYYYAHQTGDFDSLQDMIVALPTALANLRQDPALQNVPWLGNTPVDFDCVSLNLQRRLEEAIDAFKDKDINQYLKLRDRYRLEMVALRLMGDPPTQGLKVKGVYITPGCYELHKENLKDISFPAKLWATLYTPWGLSVAACQEGDTQRAIQLKPSIKPNIKAEFFAQKFVAYHEGCYYLQQQKWREAMISLGQAQPEIKASTQWQNEIDRLCGIQRQAISEFSEHLEFAQKWYDLLGSQAARSYLAEYKAEQIRDKLAKEQMSFAHASQELQKVKQIDDKNPVVIDLIERVEFSKEMQEILKLIERDRFSDAVHRAKYSKHERVRFAVAEMCIDFLIKGAETRQIPSEVMYQLGQWAYELCPNEPAFQEIYRQLRLRY